MAEGYNYALGSKKIISKHPNPYTLISVIKDELNIAEDQALVEVMCKTKKKISVKYKKLREWQDSLMKSYSKGNIELLVYQQTIGNACMIIMQILDLILILIHMGMEFPVFKMI